MQKILYPLLTLLFFNVFSFAQTGCPGCVINLPPLPADTIFLSDAPDGVAGEPYNGDISFRMPKTTTPVNATDPSTPAGLNISKITINSVVNVPPGLTWEANQMVFNPGSQTDGCVKFCGTPLQPGMYEVQVFVTAEVLLINQSTSFSFPIYIAPAGSNNDGFSMQNNAGCGAVTVDFQNNVPANGDPGYSYTWDFGNGNTSTDENPGTHTYDQPGVYEVKYKATIDTFGYMLTTVQILAAGCGDVSIPPIFNGAPDFYLKVKDPGGNLILTTPVVNNAPIPYAFTVNLPVMPGNYSLEVRDEDTFGSEGCGTVNFTQTTTGVLQSGDLKVALNIIHPVFTINSTDTVVVFPIPAPPLIVPDGIQQICQGEEIELTVNYPGNLQWYRDTSILFGQNEPVFATSSPGSYWVEYTSPDGCKAVSAQVIVATTSLPLQPAFYNVNNVLQLIDPGTLPANYSLQWFQEGTLIPGATETTYCMTEPGTSLYTLEVTNTNTGCTNQFSLGVSFNPGFDCTVAADELTRLSNTLKISPNPTNGWLTVAFETSGSLPFDLVILDATGRMVLQNRNLEANGSWSIEVDMTDLPAGLYFLKILTENGMTGGKIVKQ